MLLNVSPLGVPGPLESPGVIALTDRTDCIDCISPSSLGAPDEPGGTVLDVLTALTVFTLSPPGVSMLLGSHEIVMVIVLTALTVLTAFPPGGSGPLRSLGGSYWMY